jgi:hypothetical protein
MTQVAQGSERIKMARVAMLRPSRECIYAPSRLQPAQKTIPYTEFLERYADYPRVIQVSFADDCLSNAQPVTAYGRGLDCWYIVAPNA